MSENLNLFTDITAGRHRGNPESKAAHERILPFKQGAQTRIYEYLCGRDATSKEITTAMEIGYTTVSGRLSELKRMGAVEPTGERRAGAAVLRPVHKKTE